MPGRRGAGRARRRPGAAGKPGAPFERRLSLLGWLNEQLGFEDNRELLGDLKHADEGFDSGAGRSHVLSRLRSRAVRPRVALADLDRYDGNIRRRLDSINRGRRPPVRLRYFQHLAALHTEIVLDRQARGPGELLRSLNDFVRRRNARRVPGEAALPDFDRADLAKLAFWMATGSGKTLIFHLNYFQYLHYARRPPDNIVLITPNEGLSEQHLLELAASGISARRFDEAGGLFRSGADAIQVIEVTKLVEEKRGGGASVPVDYFEGENLIFVDEAHKGSGGEKWRTVRDRLGETGFTFEYSATFGQALGAARNEALTDEYGKAIAFDYSYRYFHGDGFGKDFGILNLREWAADETTDLLLIGNLLSFYQQQRVFAERREEVRPYGIDKPLWVFVGGRVNAVYSRDGIRRSDVLTVVRFLQRFASDRRWAERRLARLLDGRSGLVTEAKNDLFHGRYEHLRGLSLSPEELRRDILSRLFHAEADGSLHLASLGNSPGEIGLRLGTSEKYFGLIYIGDVSKFRKLVEDDGSGVRWETEAIVDSLFSNIGEADTNIEILIGAKKFIEGWNSWRVSNMGLLNVGRGEGAQIVQLFGRGVRLRGLRAGMKRSSAVTGTHPPDLGLLETLNIFSVRADYMARFREYLELEGIPAADPVVLPLPVRRNTEFLRRGLLVPKPPEERRFERESDLVFTVDTSIQAWVDRSPQLQWLSSGDSGMSAEDIDTETDIEIPEASLDILDWEEIWLKLIDYREERGWRNLAIPPEVPRRILSVREPHRLYRLGAERSVVEPPSFADRERLRDLVLDILRNYADRFYRAHSESWDTGNLELEALTEKDANFRDYTVRVEREEVKLARDIEELIRETDALYESARGRLPRIYFDRHLYQPLLLGQAEGIRSDPPGLNESEERFVRDLRQFWTDRRDELPEETELFLLRNLERGRGIGFFEGRGFFPDFILWIESRSEQRIVFVEPHGMVHAAAYANDHKARLFQVLDRFTEERRRRRPRRKRVTLDSFIVSRTSYEDIRPRYDDGTWTRERFADAHILFFDRDREYLRRILLPEGSRTSDTTGC